MKIPRGWIKKDVRYRTGCWDLPASGGGGGWGGGGGVGDRRATPQETQGGTVTEAERESTEQNSRSQVSKSFSSRRE